MAQDVTPGTYSRLESSVAHAPKGASPARVLPGAHALLVTARPRQWIKNLLVFAAPAAAASLHEPEVFVPALWAFIAFCLAASGTYCLNDARDVHADRAHPTKRHRPVAAGLLSPRAARISGLVMIGAGLMAALEVGLSLALVVGAYVLLTAAYTYALKEVAVLDIAAISLGFVLRALAGGVASDLVVTDWFIIVVSFGALFLAAGKRFSELRDLGPSASTRPALAAYSEPFLRHVTFAALTITILAYCAWAFDRPGNDPWLTASVLPLVLALLRYGLLVERGAGEAPDRVVLEDQPLQLLGLTWALAFFPGVYLV